MPILISDREVAFGPDNQPVVVTGKPLVVTAQPTQTPLIVIDSQGREQDQSGPRKAPVDGTAGTWSHTLPWPSETMNGPVLWQLRRLDGTLYQGVVPEGIPGPVDVAYLQFPPLGTTGQPLFPAWQVIRAGQAPAQVVATSPGPQGPAGPPGPTGVAGSQGIAGAAGVPYDITVYDPTVAYTYGHGVSFQGSTFLALRNIPPGVSPPSPAIDTPDWRVLLAGESALTPPAGALLLGTGLAYGRVPPAGDLLVGTGLAYGRPAVTHPHPGLLGVLFL